MLITLLEKYETQRKLLKKRFTLVTSLLIVSTRISRSPVRMPVLITNSEDYVVKKTTLRKIIKSFDDRRLSWKT